MKKYAIFLLTALPLFSCSDDNTTPSSPIYDKTYDASSGLELYYNGTIMPGKTVNLSQNGNTTEILAFSEFDLSQLSAFGLSGKIPAPGIIPGSPRININTVASPANGGWTFNGTSANDFCKFAYSGFATDDKLKLFINDISLNTSISPEVWKPAPIEQNSDGTFKSLPIYVDWQYTPLPDIDIDFNEVLSALTMLPVIPVYNNTAYMSVSEALSEVLRSIAFKADGNIIFSYINSSFGAARIDQTQPNGYQYIVDSPSTVKLFINPLSFFSLLLNNTSGGTPEADVDLNDHGLFPAKKSASYKSTLISTELTKQIIKSALETIMPQLADGISLSFNATSKGMNVYLDTEMTVTLLNSIIIPILKDDKTIKGIISYIESDATLKPLLPTIEKALTIIPQIFERTNTLRVGISLLPMQ